MTQSKFPEIGKKIRDRSVILTDGSATKLTALSGKRGVVLYFYPKDNTSGCTVEANGFNELLKEFTDEGFSVTGVSPDSPSSHKKFVDKCNLKFSLISDEKKELCEAFGVWAEKSMYGKKYMGVLRTTFILDPDLRLLKMYERVKPVGHARFILDDVRGGLE
jgi:peroxiredoxin Q/BCP